MKKIALHLTLILFLLHSNFIEIQSSWLISCKPCVEVLAFCNFCQTIGQCIECANNINTSCFNCLNDIFYYGNNPFYCDFSIKYQELACNYYCKSGKFIGHCDKVNGKCTCTTS